MWLCWLRRLKWMWFDFSLKLSTQSVRLNSSLRSFISFSEMKKKLQSLHWGRKRSRRSRWWRRSWRTWTDTSQLFHTQSKTWRRWWKPVTSAFWRSDFRWLIDWLIDWWLIELLMINGVFVLQEFPVSMERWVICWCLWSLCFWSKPLQFWSWMFFQSPDLITAGSTDAFWRFDSCATLLGQPALQSLEEDAGHRPEQWVWLQKIWARIHTHWKWCNIDRFQHYVWRTRSSTATKSAAHFRKGCKKYSKIKLKLKYRYSVKNLLN